MPEGNAQNTIGPRTQVGGICLRWSDEMARKGEEKFSILEAWASIGPGHEFFKEGER